MAFLKLIQLNCERIAIVGFNKTKNYELKLVSKNTSSSMLLTSNFFKASN